MLIYYRKKPNSLNFLIEIIIEIDNKFDKLVIKTYYNNFENKVKTYKNHLSYYNRRPKTNK